MCRTKVVVDPRKQSENGEKATEGSSGLYLIQQLESIVVFIVVERVARECGIATCSHIMSDAADKHRRLLRPYVFGRILA